MTGPGGVVLGSALVFYACIESQLRTIRWVLFRERPWTRVTCVPSTFNRAVLEQCRALVDFRPPVWACGPLLQLLLAMLCPAPSIAYSSEAVAMSDGGEVVLDWVAPDQEDPAWAGPAGGGRPRPVLLVLHGIAGHSQERYVRRMVAEMRRHGWLVVVYNRRGHKAAAHPQPGDSPPTRSPFGSAPSAVAAVAAVLLCCTRTLRCCVQTGASGLRLVSLWACVCWTRLRGLRACTKPSEPSKRSSTYGGGNSVATGVLAGDAASAGVALAGRGLARGRTPFEAAHSGQAGHGCGAADCTRGADEPEVMGCVPGSTWQWGDPGAPLPGRTGREPEVGNTGAELSPRSLDNTHELMLCSSRTLVDCEVGCGACGNGKTGQLSGGLAATEWGAGAELPTNRDRVTNGSSAAAVAPGGVGHTCERPGAEMPTQLPRIVTESAGVGRGARTFRPWPLYSDIDDMLEVVRHIRRATATGEELPRRLFAAVGFSAGANCLTKFVGSLGGDCGLDAAVSVANGYDIRRGLDYVRRHARLVDWFISLSLHNLYQRCSPSIEVHSPTVVKPSHVKRSRSVRDIDQAITSKLYNVDVDAYYESQSSIANAPRVAIPMLYLNAADDSVIAPDLVGLGEVFAEQNEKVVSVLTSHGGHLGWVHGWRKQWMCRSIAEYLQAVHQQWVRASTHEDYERVWG